MSDLKPCPFCGGEVATITEHQGYQDPTIYAGLCKKCRARGPYCHTEAEAIAAWNRRAPAPSAEGEALREAAKAVVRSELGKKMARDDWAQDFRGDILPRACGKTYFSQKLKALEAALATQPSAEPAAEVCEVCEVCMGDGGLLYNPCLACNGTGNRPAKAKE
jgi:Lar family restriction alleviation protein